MNTLLTYVYIYNISGVLNEPHTACEEMVGAVIGEITARASTRVRCPYTGRLSVLRSLLSSLLSLPLLLAARHRSG
jgi:hypothetical protein